MSLLRRGGNTDVEKQGNFSQRFEHVLPIVEAKANAVGFCHVEKSADVLTNSKNHQEVCKEEGNTKTAMDEKLRHEQHLAGYTQSKQEQIEPHLVAAKSDKDEDGRESEKKESASQSSPPDSLHLEPCLESTDKVEKERPVADEDSARITNGKISVTESFGEKLEEKIARNGNASAHRPSAQLAVIRNPTSQRNDDGFHDIIGDNDLSKIASRINEENESKIELMQIIRGSIAHCILERIGMVDGADIINDPFEAIEPEPANNDTVLSVRPNPSVSSFSTSRKRPRIVFKLSITKQRGTPASQVDPKPKEEMQNDD